MLITVFTPTFNRAYIIDKLYKSLQKQTFRDFEWIIIDDGSTDNTSDVISSFQQDNNDFVINYYHQKNNGKCSAINHALDLAHGKLFLCIDSDDYLTDDALEKIAKWQQSIAGKKEYCGVCGNLGTASNITPNSTFSELYCDGTFFDRYSIFDGERAYAFYTDIHRKYKYPFFEGEKFMTEAVVWNRMAANGYKMRFYNDIICV
ncbi:MAG: glycosyltransferase family 2 protein [Clostridiales bacterium]|nr:glycosyltransferase family 2 protein [Clostridiales bacterium]